MPHPESPVITLLSDFGTADTYVAIMKGVMLSRCPGVRLIDLSHHVPPGRVHAAGYLLSTVWRYFPPKTVHLVVVDPGVGTQRRHIAAEVGGHRFVAPDNGVLSEVFADTKPDCVSVVEDESIFVKPVSRTFHGRDIFAPPTAAALAAGRSVESLGTTIDDPVLVIPADTQSRPDGGIAGSVVHVDRFGNLVTSIRETQLPVNAVIDLSGREIGPVQGTYGDVPLGSPLAVIGSSGRLEVSVHGFSAATSLGARVGDPVVARPSGVRG